MKPDLDPKSVTRERAETMLKRAIEGSRRLRMDDVADYYESLSVEEYAAEKGLRLTNPSKPSKGRTVMNATKEELLHENTELLSVLDEVWNAVVDADETTSKDDLLAATDEVVDILNDYDDERFPVEEDDEGESVAAQSEDDD